MKMSSRKTMLTAAVLVTLSSGTTYAATPETVDSQDLFHANRLVTDPAKNPAVEETSVGDQYEASISGQKKTSSSAQAPETSTQVKPARLRWESVDARLAARNNEPSFNLSAQKAKPVIITAEDIRREEKLAAKEGRPVRELVGETKEINISYRGRELCEWGCGIHIHQCNVFHRPSAFCAGICCIE